MKQIRTAVIGVGYLGHFHAQKYTELSQSKLIAICDIDSNRCAEIAYELHTKPVDDYRSLIGQVDAVSIAVPTLLHHKIGKFFLENGIHVLMEKPIATNLSEAEELVTIAQKNQVILQVGHLERFNNVIKAVEPLVNQPLFIESLRLAPFKLRGSDVNVILDLMIHDIDLIQSLVKSKIVEIRANGTPVLSPSVDIANARIEFANGCVANVTANRTSLKMQRQLRIFQHDCYIALDLAEKKLSISRKGSQEMFPGISEIVSENHVFEKGDALKDQIATFLTSIQEGRPSMVSGEDGKYALETAIKITQIVHAQLDQYRINTVASREPNIIN